MSEQATFVTLDNLVNGWRQRILFYLDTTIWGKLWEVGDFLLNVALCVVYIINTTFVSSKNGPIRIPSSARLAEFLIAIIFLGQYIARFVVINRNHRTLEHAVVFFAFAAPVIAYILSTNSASTRDSYMSAGVLAIFYPARFLRLHYAISRLLALVAASTNYVRLTLIRQEAASLGGDIAVAILFFSSVVHSGVNWYSQVYNVQFVGFSFLDAIAFISLGALGKDDSIPRSVFSEVISMVIVALIAFTVPSRITRMVDLALKTSAYSKTVALPAASRHALVCGHIDLESIRQFLHEFFNADHGPNIFKATIVILHGDEPSMEMKALLRDPAYTNRVFYVKGFKALKKARIDLASCVYILTRKHCHGTGVEEDAETVLTALALSAFSTTVVPRNTENALSLSAPRFKVYAQTVLPGSIAHMNYLQATRVICVDEMRMGIMAQNCATPGFATLAFILSTSVASQFEWDFSGVLAEAIAKSAEDSWVKNYIHGIGQEIYQAHVPDSLVGKSFFKVARYFYRCHGLLIFGVGSFSPNRSPHHHIHHHPSVNTDAGYYQVLLSPRSYILQQYDMLFTISSDVQSVLDAAVFAERVTIKSAKIPNVGTSASGYNASTANSTPPVSPVSPVSRASHLSRKPFVSILTSSPQSAEADKDLTSSAPVDSSPVQLDSPRRVIARLGSAKRPQRTNYISDSDSSYFSPARNLDAVARGDDISLLPSIKGYVRTRIEKVARRFDTVPSEIRNHIVICDASDMFPRNVELLIQALKNAFEDDGLPIVILSPAQLDREREHVLNDFLQVYMVRGTPLSQSDLRRTRIERAQKAIILGSCNDRAHKENAESSSDSAAILANMNIQSICGGQFVMTTELLDIESIRYLDHTQLLGEPLLKRTFMGGHIFMPSMIDTALCQCYFSSHILDVLRHLTFSHLPSDRVSSTVETPKSEEAAMIRSYRPGKLSLLYVPERFIGKRYDTLVLTLMKRHGSVPLGIYRIVSHEGQAFASVICNPLPYMPLVPSDAVYVLGPGIPDWIHVSEGLRNLRIAPQTAATTESTSPTSGAACKGSGGSGTSQSRQTVYSHNTDKNSVEDRDNMADSEFSDTDIKFQVGPQSGSVSN
ncbi:hypothetical protein GGI12_003673 [Dipsacomyces acuminosporus]|nr:hypothetical protein GGI12_003673 [Dipsacomyces acuminosporus]